MKKNLFIFLLFLTATSCSTLKKYRSKKHSPRKAANIKSNSKRIAPKATPKVVSLPQVSANKASGNIKLLPFQQHQGGQIYKAEAAFDSPRDQRYFVDDYSFLLKTDGQTLLTNVFDLRKVNIIKWSPNTLSLQSGYISLDKEVTTIPALSPDKKSILIGQQEQSLYSLWNLQTLGHIKDIHLDKVNEAIFIDPQTLLVNRNQDYKLSSGKIIKKWLSTLELYSLASNKTLRQGQLIKNNKNESLIIKDGFIFSEKGESSKDIFVYNSQTLAPLKTLKCHTSAPHLYSPPQSSFILGLSQNAQGQLEMCLWNSQNHNLIVKKVISGFHSGQSHNATNFRMRTDLVGLSNDGKYFVVGNRYTKHQGKEYFPRFSEVFILDLQGNIKKKIVDLPFEIASSTIIGNQVIATGVYRKSYQDLPEGRIYLGAF